MELNDRVYELSVQGNLHGQPVYVVLNGNKIPAGDTFVQAKHIIKSLEFETGKIRGCSILEHYSVKDGFLTDKEGNQIHFSSERFPEIKINRIKTPFLLNDEVEVDLAYIKDVTSLLNMQNPEDTIKGFSDEEIKALQDEKERALAEVEAKRLEQEAEDARIKAEEDEKAAEAARVAEEEAKTKAEQEAAAEATRIAEEEAKKSEEARIQAEKEAEDAKKAEEEAKIQAEKSAKEAEEAAEAERARIAEEEKAYVLSPKLFDKLARRCKNARMKEYTKDGYHFFYGPNPIAPMEPCILKKRNNGDYEELKGGIIDQSEEEVEFEFEHVDGTQFTAILNLESEDMNIEKD